jgi:hypothetical protein
MISRVALGQFNDSTSYYTSYVAAGVINKTNDRSSYVLNNASKFSISKKNISLNAVAAWIYGKQQTLLTNNDISTALDFNLYETFPHFYYWGLGTFDKSYSLKINNRFQSGAGIGYSFFHTKTLVLNISDGIIYEKGDRTVGDEFGRTKYETFRNSFRVKFHAVIAKVIVLDGSDFWQPSLSDKDDYIIKSNTSVSIKLQKWLSFTTSLTYNKLNLTHRENLLLNFGFAAEKYF